MTETPSNAEQGEWVLVPRAAGGEWITRLGSILIKETGQSPGGTKIAQTIRRVLDSAPRAPPPPSADVEEAQAALNVARTLMEENGGWTNPAGYQTDAALWIERAQQALSRPSPSARQGEVSDEVVEKMARASWSNALGHAVTDEDWPTMREVEMANMRAALAAWGEGE